MHDPRSDEELVEAANHGDSAAFEALYYRYRDWVSALAYRFTGNHDDALDVLQETFLYLLKKFPGFQLTSRMTTFLYPAVKNLSIARRQKSRRFVAEQEPLEDRAQQAAPSPGSVRSELATVMARLSEEHREVVLMRFVDDMSLEDIAQSLGIPLGTVKSRLHHALGELRTNPATQRYFGQA